MILKKTLYKYDEKNRLRFWTIILDNNKVYSIYGFENGKKIKSSPQIFKNSILKSGNQLAQTFFNKTIKLKLLKGFQETKNKKDGITLLPMRAHKYEEHSHKIIYPAYIQRKYDGFRCLSYYDKKLDKVILLSNNGKPFYNLEMIEQQLKPFFKNNSDLYFDGELYIHNTKLQSISSLLLSKKTVDTSNIIYNIFDCFFLTNLNLNFYSRYQFLLKLFKDKNKNRNTKLNLVECIDVKNKEEIDKYFHKFLGEGYEGVIVRNFDGLYKLNGKSYDVLRSKEFKNDTFKIVGAKKGSGKQKESVIWILQCLNNKNKTFNAIPYGTIKEREKWWNERAQYLNKNVLVKYILKDDEGCIVRNPIVIM
jgi:ATP-dependent DNA ligase